MPAAADGRLITGFKRKSQQSKSPIPAVEKAQTCLLQQETSMSCEMKPLTCDPAKLAGLSEKLIVSHYENNYGGAVKRLNAITTQLAGIDVTSAPVFVLNGLKREELIAANSVILHETYFDSLGAGDEVTGDLETALSRDFGSIERWAAEFTALGKALAGGSGWVFLSWCPSLGRLT